MFEQLVHASIAIGAFVTFILAHAVYTAWWDGRW